MGERFYPTPYDAARIIKVLVPGAAVGLSHHNGEREDIWTRTTLRKDNRCTRCWCGIKKGEEAFRPMTFKDHRSARICVRCMKQIERKEDRRP